MTHWRFIVRSASVLSSPEYDDYVVIMVLILLPFNAFRGELGHKIDIPDLLNQVALG